MTELGEVVNNIMMHSFPSIVDVSFTANMESLLDGVAEGKVRWKTIIENFYPDLDAAVKKAEEELEEVKIEDEVTDVICEECGRNMVIKYEMCIRDRCWNSLQKFRYYNLQDQGEPGLQGH